MKSHYTVKSPLSFDNHFFGVGDPIELDHKTAKPLLEGGVIAAAGVEQPAKANGKSAGKSE